MLNERYKIIDKIVNGNSVRLRRPYFEKNYINVYNQIIEFNKKISDIPFIQMIWHWVNNSSNYYLCCCGKRTSFNKNWENGYKKYCSTKCSHSSDETKMKRKATTLLKYGVDNIAKLDSIKKKQEITNIEKYGHKSSFQNEDVKKKYKKTIEEKWGVDHYFKTDDFRVKSKKYYLEKWGVEHQLDVEEIKQRIKETCLKKYGVSTYLNTEHSRSCIKSYNRSSYEDEIYDWLISINLKVEKSNRSVINPLLLDILLPEFNLALEFNGLYWHSELFKEKGYHLNKTKKCRENNVMLIHIWEDDWVNRKQVIKSIILNRIGKIENKIWARKCKIRSLSNEETSIFLNENHIQGYTKFSESIGLYYNNELVSLMCFGWRSTNGKKEYELIRFCNKLFTSVVGGASKLFQSFIKKNNIEEVTSYSDISIFEGSLYKKIGFKYVRSSDINYWWVVKGVRRHRFGYNKKKLVKNGYDPLKTEVEIMHELGNYRVWGCGQEKWMYKLNS